VRGAACDGKALHEAPGRPCAQSPPPPRRSPNEPLGYHRCVAEQTQSVPLEQQLAEIGAQLAWVRDYL
jgi:hypothetical protein